MTPSRHRHQTLVAAATLLLGLGSCTTEPEQLPTYPVALRLGGALPADGRVGEYTVTFTTGQVVLGDWWIYGMDREAAGYAALSKHAGHVHGEADFETQVAGTFAVNLLAEPQIVTTAEMTEGHYFDGSIRLRPAMDPYAPVYADDQRPVSSHDALWGHSLVLTGTATSDASATYEFNITVDAEAMIAGLVYGGTVWEHGTEVITTRLDLGAMLQDVDFAALADEQDQVLVNATTHPDTYNLIKARLQDPTLYLHSEAETIPK